MRSVSFARACVVAAAAAICCCCGAASASSLMLPTIFKDGVVLQHTAPNVFGYADPHARVVVNVTATDGAATTHSAVANSAGRWTVRIQPCADPRGEATVSVAALPPATPETGAPAPEAEVVLLHRVTFGEVFLCGGQSNMEMSVEAASSGNINASDPAIQNRTWPSIRLFQVVNGLTFPPWSVNKSVPQRDLPAFINGSATTCGWGAVRGQGTPTNPDAHVCQEWQVAAPGVTDKFSAECFYTAMSLVERGAVPDGRAVGLVLSAYSGTRMEVWMPPEAFEGCPNYTSTAAAHQAATVGRPASPQQEEQHLQALGQWVLPTAPSCLFNSMVNPIVGFGLRALIWNQGEANMGQSYPQFSCLFQNMIAAWRARWGLGDFAFLATQLGDQGGSWPEYVPGFRDAQLSILPGRGRTPRAAVVSAYDQGDHCGGGKCAGSGPCVWSQHSGNNCSAATGQCCTNPFGFFGVHSRFKQEIGRRMALAVEALCNFSSSSATPAPPSDRSPAAAAAAAAAVADWQGPYPTGATAASDGTITIQFATTSSAPLAAASAPAMYINGTRDCWECCTARAQDVFQVSYRSPGPSDDQHGEPWTNTTFVFDTATGTAVVTPVSPAPQSHAFVVVRYAASLWPQCAVYSASNDIPAWSFGNLSITPAIGRY